MIITDNYQTDLNYSLRFCLVTLTFNSVNVLTLSELFNNQLLPVELNNSFTEGFKLDYCKNQVKYREINIISEDKVYDFSITCPVKFSEIDFNSLISRRLTVTTTGEKIGENLLTYILNKV